MGAHNWIMRIYLKNILNIFNLKLKNHLIFCYFIAYQKNHFILCSSQNKQRIISSNVHHEHFTLCNEG